jgi:hypothetical protein
VAANLRRRTVPALAESSSTAPEAAMPKARATWAADDEWRG